MIKSAKFSKYTIDKKQLGAFFMRSSKKSIYRRITQVNLNTKQTLSPDENQIDHNYIIHFMYVIIP
jgi:hypothetical protein